MCVCVSMEVFLFSPAFTKNILRFITYIYGFDGTEDYANPVLKPPRVVPTIQWYPSYGTLSWFVVGPPVSVLSYSLWRRAGFLMTFRIDLICIVRGITVMNTCLNDAVRMRSF